MKGKRLYILWILLFGLIMPLAIFKISVTTISDWALANIPLHSVFEALGFFASIVLATILLHKKDQNNLSVDYVIISSAILALGILDGFHALVGPGNTFVWLHSIAVLLGGAILSLLLVPLKDQTVVKAWRLPIIVIVFSILIGIYSLSFPDHLPSMIVVGKFTVLSDAINVVGGILFLLSGTYLLFKLWNKRNIFFILLAIFCLLLGTSGIIFPFGEIWTFEWWSWHVLRVIAYIILLGYAMYLFSETTKQTIKISENLKTKNNHITDLLESVKNSVNVLVSSSIEIQATATQVSSGVSETATAISQTTATVKEVKLSSLESEKKATNVLDSAEEVLNASDSGTMAVQAIIIGMEQINKSMNSITEKIGVMQYNSQSIGEIITSVSDIAKQSKILSINAEIEAAKAGEHGVGFMVVANEIKSMADQSSQSTKEIIKILDDIQKATTSAVVASKQGTKSVEDGIKQTNNAGNAIQKLTESGQKALQAASQIVASSNQQVVGMNQIDNAMQNIYQAGMDNEKSMFQTESAARELNELSETLKKLLEKYDELND